jgi:hypothetical protein
MKVLYYPVIDDVGECLALLRAGNCWSGQLDAYNCDDVNAALKLWQAEVES